MQADQISIEKKSCFKPVVKDLFLEKLRIILQDTRLGDAFSHH
jgi:hypothetical protein